MIYQTKSEIREWNKYFFSILAIVLFTILCTSQSKATASVQTELVKYNSLTAIFNDTIIPEYVHVDMADDIYKVVEQMPLWADCSSQECSDKSLLEYTSKNLTYPKLARENGIEGSVFIQFIVDEDGLVHDPKIVRDIGGGCGEAALEMIQSMNDYETLWQPGRQKGMKVKVLLTIPVVFNLTNKPNENHIALPTKKEVNKIFKKVERMPFWKDCDSKACSDKELIRYVYTNLRYPVKAMKNKIKGRVYVQFVVEPDGYVSEAKVIRDLGSGCGEAALRVVNAMNDDGPSWQPGMIDGENVRVFYTLPVTFKLEK